MPDKTIPDLRDIEAEILRLKVRITGNIVAIVGELAGMAIVITYLVTHCK